jgi:hypothetical protein
MRGGGLTVSRPAVSYHHGKAFAVLMVLSTLSYGVQAAKCGEMGRYLKLQLS